MYILEPVRLVQKEGQPFRRERLGFIFQDCNLLDTLTAFENIALALTIRRTPVGEIEERVAETARWTPSRPACCWTGLRPSTGNGRLRS